MAVKVTTPKKKREMALLGLLVVVLGYYILHTFVFTGSSSKSNSKSQARTAPSTTRSGSGAGSGQSESDESAATRATKIQLLLEDTSPLELHLLKTGGGSSTLAARGNIFDYYKPPPPPPQKLPDPPPIKLGYLQPQTVIAGTPRSFKLSVNGSAFPPDAQILINGGARQTKRVNDTTLTTEIAANEYSSPRSFAIDVKSQSDPKLYSNQISFVVQPSPDPPFKYVGRIGDIAILETGIKEFARLTKGGTIQGVWRIEAISDAGVDVIHTQYEIRKRVVMQDKGR